MWWRISEDKARERLRKALLFWVPEADALSDAEIAAIAQYARAMLHERDVTLERAYRTHQPLREMR